MRAMVITDFGDTDVFEEREVETPEPGPTEVRVTVHASSVNPVDYKIRQAGSWANVSPPAIIGYDVSGVVDAVGEAVTDFAVGDEVFYTPEIFVGEGSYAEYHVAAADIVAHKPPSLTHEEAAVLPLAGGTAWDAVIERGDVEAGETVLIHGTGGVGSVAAQLALASGARVVTVSSPETAPLMADLGVDLVLDYTADDVTDAVQAHFDADEPIDLVVDTVGGTAVADSMDVLRPHGTAVTIQNPQGDVGAQYAKNPTLELLFLERARDKLDGLRRLVESGHLEPMIDSTRPVQEVARAHELVEAGGLEGKIALDVDFA
ncbi:NADPH:quinone reductase or related Zn-dependent oxidoreductase [Halanaeroarchaeum sp. HSR-CO]|uniref:zinc-binding dehydrogenase n=1 Tax=Halanaeroarchaeum sp. HSR-CO TaxID=2866382 RepID=UPI00217DFCAB|nr:zinc-binding dehydrogenase [Halanaeroarchaeum sp. HSR-CO]UWG49040.1 NADPH:quinone reductase or related Zn-dependent oxidoreductase [Halanaeroarchaeum sp. HSR-CO]